MQEGEWHSLSLRMGAAGLVSAHACEGWEGRGSGLKTHWFPAETWNGITEERFWIQLNQPSVTFS
jgi:hypothetical protein